MTSTTSTPIPPTISSFDPHLLKLLAHHHQQQQQQQQQQFSAKEYLQHAYFYNHPPPNTVATNLPRHLLGNGLSKLNTEKTLSNLKISTSNNDKFDQKELPIDSQKKKFSSQQAKDALTFDQWLQPPPGSLIQGPVCLQSDTSSSTSSAAADLKSETVLSSGERITCFVVGGEKRLCLPEILNTVLKDFSLQEINAACERLHIYCSRCTNEQLDILKITQVLPMNAPSCGLITQTDAERLCANLLQLRYKGQLRSVNSMGINPYERLYSIKVQHKCFGKCSGTIYPTLYVAPHAECIQCDTCQALFSPKTFVSHGHKSEENRICHWGFNSDNWRAYLKIRSTEDRKAHEELELIKEKFLNNNNNNNQTQNKRLIQAEDLLISNEKGAKHIISSTNHHSFQPTAFSSVKKDNHSGEYSFSSRLSNSNLIPSHKASSSSQQETTTAPSNCSRPTPLRVVHSNSPILDEPTNPSIINFNDFSANGIRQIVESTVTSVNARQHLLSFISQLQLAAYKTNSNRIDIESNETTLLRRENELLRERLSKLESNQMSSNDSNIHRDSINGDSDDSESNTSSSSATTTTANDQPKYYDRKRRLLAAEQMISNDETKKCHPYKKACLDRIVDSLNQKAAQAEQEETHDEKLLITPEQSLTPPATTPERTEQDDDDGDEEEEDIDIDEQQ